MSMFSLMDLAAGVGVPCLVGAVRCQDETTGNVRRTSIHRRETALVTEDSPLCCHCRSANRWSDNLPRLSRVNQRSVWHRDGERLDPTKGAFAPVQSARR